MPLDKDPLPKSQIAVIRRWIDQGAAWPDTPGEVTAAMPSHEAPPHWAYVKPVRHAPPPVRDERWVRTPIDRFVLARLESRRPDPVARGRRENRCFAACRST